MSNPAPVSFPIMRVMRERWSTRLFDTSHELTNAEVETILEAGRWAPSAYNTQPWRYIVGKRGGEVFGRIVETLSGWNKSWAPSASVLVMAVAEKIGTDDGRERTHGEYDTGASIAQMALQAVDMGFAAHSMSGFDSEIATRLFGVADNMKVMSVTAIGKYDSSRVDVDEKILAGESAERVRKPLDALLLDRDE